MGVISQHRRRAFFSRKVKVRGFCVFVTLLFLQCVSINEASAQWRNVANGLLGTIPNACCGFSNIHFKSGVCWAGATSLFVSRDSGLTWTTVPNFNNGRITEINFFDTQNGVIATLNGVWKTADGGLNWQQILNSTTCYGVEFAGSVNKIVASSDGSRASFYYTNDGGVSWQSKNTGLHNLAVLGMTDGSAYRFAGTGSTGSLFYTNNQGAGWSLLSNTDYDSFSLALDSDGVYTYLLNEEGHIWSDHLASFIRSGDAGATWQKLTSYTPQYYTGGISVQRCAIYCQSLSNGILRSVDKGTTWISIGGPNNFIDTRLVCAISSNLVLAADGSGSIWRTTNSGGKPLSTGLPATSLPAPLSVSGCLPDSLMMVVFGAGCESFTLKDASLGELIVQLLFSENRIFQNYLATELLIHY